MEIKLLRRTSALIKAESWISANPFYRQSWPGLCNRVDKEIDGLEIGLWASLLSPPPPFGGCTRCAEAEWRSGAMCKLQNILCECPLTSWPWAGSCDGFHPKLESWWLPYYRSIWIFLVNHHRPWLIFIVVWKWSSCSIISCAAVHCGPRRQNPSFWCIFIHATFNCQLLPSNGNEQMVCATPIGLQAYNVGADEKLCIWLQR